MHKYIFLFLWWMYSFDASATLTQQKTATGECTKKVSLVLIHGFNGSEGTWTELIDLVTGDASLACVDAYTFSYPTGYVPEQPNIDELATSLRGELSKLAQTQELMLVAHSMGGIVTKKAILQDAASPQFLPRTKQVLFIASPHLGIRRPIAFFAGTKSVQAKGLRRPNIRKLQRQWEDESVALPCTAIAAKKDVLVTRHSAKGKFEDAIVIAGDHVSVAHPESKEHPTFQLLKKSLLATLTTN
jgi:pimeloyl-ACP methyl ester carboxylesterase